VLLLLLGELRCCGFVSLCFEHDGGGRGDTNTVDSMVVGIVVVMVVNCVRVEVTKSFVFVAVTVTTEASGALFAKPPNLSALSATNCFLTSPSSATPLLNFAEETFWKIVLRIVISILANGSAIQFGVGEAQDAFALTVVWVI
jgi:hypothetical protein